MSDKSRDEIQEKFDQAELRRYRQVRQAHLLVAEDRLKADKRLVEAKKVIQGIDADIAVLRKTLSELNLKRNEAFLDVEDLLCSELPEEYKKRK